MWGASLFVSVVPTIKSRLALNSGSSRLSLLSARTNDMYYTCCKISSSNYDYQGSSFSWFRLPTVKIWQYLKILSGGGASSETAQLVVLDIKT